MTLHCTLLLSFLIVFNSCDGQASKQALKEHTQGSKPSPVVVRTPLPPGFRFGSANDDTTLVSQYIRSIYQDSKGNLWFGTVTEGLCKYDGDTLRYYTPLDVFDGKSVHAIAEDKKGNVWFATNKYVINYDGKHFSKFGEQEGLGDIPMNRRDCITNNLLIDQSDNLWLSTPKGVYRFNGKGFTVFPLLPGITFTNMLQDNAGAIWFASTDSGVYRLDTRLPDMQKNSIRHITAKEGLLSNNVGAMLQDKNGIIWFATDKGISQYDGKRFNQLTTTEGIPNDEIWGIYEEKSGIIWITARGSTTQYNPDAVLKGGKRFTIFTPNDGINCCVQSMYQDQKGKMWWGAGSGLFQFDGKQFYQVKQKGPWPW